MKKCATCKEIKTSEQYNKNKRNEDGIDTYCKSCRSAFRKALYQKRISPNRACNLKRFYGIGIPEYNAMLIEQNGKCKICGSTDPRGRGGNFHVDHDHESKSIRGLLCSFCNTALGLMEDSPDRLRAAAKYVEDFNYIKKALTKELK
jgi:hypothetical protein